MLTITELFVLIANHIRATEDERSSSLPKAIFDGFQQKPTRMSTLGPALPRLQHFEHASQDAYVFDALAIDVAASSGVSCYYNISTIVSSLQHCAEGAREGNHAKIFSSLESLILNSALVGTRTINVVNTGTHFMNTLSVSQLQNVVTGFQSAGAALAPFSASVGAFTGTLSLIDGIMQLYREFGRSVASKTLFITISMVLESELNRHDERSDATTNADIKYAYLAYLPSEFSAIAWVAYKYKPSWFETTRSFISKIGLPILVIGASILTLIVIGASIASLGTVALILGGLAGAIALGLCGYKSVKAFYSAHKLKEIVESLERRPDVQRLVTNIGAKQERLSLRKQVEYCLPPISFHRLFGPTLGDYLRYFTAFNFLRILQQRPIQLSTTLNPALCVQSNGYDPAYLAARAHEITGIFLNSCTLTAMEIIHMDVPDGSWKSVINFVRQEGADAPQDLDKIKAFFSLLRVNR